MIQNKNQKIESDEEEDIYEPGTIDVNNIY